MNIKSISIWSLSGLLALVFLMAGTAKVTGSEQMVQNFQHMGLPLTMMFLIGAAEIAGAIGLLLPSLAPFASLGLTAIMAGAIGTHVLMGDFTGAMVPATLTILTIIVGIVRREPLEKLLKQFKLQH